MKQAWIVVRKEKHIDDKFWVCFAKEDALKIAKDVVTYWETEYKSFGSEVDKKCYGDTIFNFGADGMFWVYVQPQQIREIGEHIKRTE